MLHSLSVKIKTFKLTFLTCWLVSDLSRVSPLVCHDCFLARQTRLNESFYMYIWHGNYKIILSTLILGLFLFHIVCVAFCRAELKAEVKHAGLVQAHMSSQL